MPTSPGGALRSGSRRAHGPTLHADGTTAFRVWAPWADRVEVVLADRHAAMAREDRGWFTATLEALPGEDYGFSLDGDPVRPDPASRWQPNGVHEPSRLLDLDALRGTALSPWRAPPLERAVFYELHVGAFTPEGTFASAAQRVGELAALGITHIELMPIAAFSGDRGWGYDGVCWRAVHEPYGGSAGLTGFVQACHAAGLAVVLDVVYNHLGPSGNYLPEFGPYLTDRYSTPWGDAINLDGPGSDQVRGLIVGSALAWLDDYGVDGLRLDAVHALFDNSATHILAELSQAVDALAHRLGRPLAVIAESDRNDPATVRPRREGGQGIHAQWSDDLHHAIHTAVTGERDGYYADFAGLSDVAAAYRHGFVYAGRYSPARERTVGAPLPDEVPGHRLVACLQNHDQVGNRAFGERLTALAPPAVVRACAVLLCAAPHAPLLFMGEEFAAQTPFLYFTGHIEDHLAEAIAAGRRDEFAAFSSFVGQIPDPQAESTFRRSRLDWREATAGAGEQRRALWRDLLALRRAQPALASDRRDLVEHLAVDSDCLAMLRRGPEGRGDALIAVNLGEAELQRGLGIAPGRWSVLLSSDDSVYGGSGAAATMTAAGRDSMLTLPPRSATILTASPPL